jgi:dihydroorotase
MRILFKSVLIQDSSSDFNNQIVDLLHEHGQWIQIGKDLNEKADLIIDQPNLAWAPSIVDLRVHNTLPGGEFKEDWFSLSAAAKKGGVLDLLLLPTGDPVPQQPQALEFVKNMSKVHGVNFVAMAPLTIDNQGENFTDLFDLFSSGSHWFAHGNSSIQNVDLMSKCLQYLQSLPVTLISRPDTTGLSIYGQIHEGLQSTLLGLKGIPYLTETLSIKRDLDLLFYTLSNSFGHTHAKFRLHFSCLSCSESVDLIRAAKKKGLPVSCDVAVHQLIFTEDSISDFDSMKKVFPPFRTATDVDSLWAGIQDGTIDAIVSDHMPHESEVKDVEFDHAAFGTIGLETLFLACYQEAVNRKISFIDQLISYNPANLMGLSLPTIGIGNESKGILFQKVPEYPYVIDQIVSKSKNSAFLGYTFNHKILMVLNHRDIAYTIQ